MSDIFNMADTWNAGGTTFTAIKMNVTDTTSAAASLLMDLQVGGASRFKITKAGRIEAASSISTSFVETSGVLVNYVANTLGLGSTGILQWSAGIPAAAGDLTLLRDAADTLAQRRSTNAQTFRTYGTYTDASNYRRVAMAMTTAGVATLRAEGAGTGASGNVLHISSLPTSNPGAGILWNNAGTPAIGT